MRRIYIANKLEVVCTDRIAVPGCEPESALTSVVLSRLRTCKSAYVKLDLALAAIPGSSIEWQVNNGMSNGARRKWFVLPPYYPQCPCNWMPDYYAILRSLASVEEEPESIDECAVFDQGFCPSKRYAEMLPPAVKPYVPEGTVFAEHPSILFGPYYFGNNPLEGDVPVLV